MILRIIGGRFKGRILQSPQNIHTRPTRAVLREAFFNICQHHIEGSRFLDLYAGSGAMGCEALSRKALHATFVESDPKAIACIRSNIAALHVEDQTTLFPCEIFAALKKIQTTFHIVYIDPPYELPEDILHHVVRELVHRHLLADRKALLFVETRASQEPPSLPLMTLTDSRRYGSTALYQYEAP